MTIISLGRNQTAHIDDIALVLSSARCRDLRRAARGEHFIRAMDSLFAVYLAGADAVAGSAPPCRRVLVTLMSTFGRSTQCLLVKLSVLALVT